jgi:hypothetical protein
MAVYIEEPAVLPLIEENAILAVDLSSASYIAVQAVGAATAGKPTVQLPASKGVMCFGILQNPGDQAPALTSGQTGRFARLGYSRGYAGATFNSNIELTADTDGSLKTATSGQWVVAISQEAATAVGAIVRVFMNGGYYKA